MFIDNSMMKFTSGHTQYYCNYRSYKVMQMMKCFLEAHVFLSCSSFHLLIISSFLCAATDDANVSENEKSKYS